MDMARACGPFGFLIMALGVLAVLISFAAAIAAVATTNRRVWIVTSAASLVLGVVIAGLASLGTTLGRSRTDRALRESTVAADEADRLRAAGYAEAGQCLPVGMLSASMPVLVGAVALAFAILRKAQPDTSTSPGRR